MKKPWKQLGSSKQKEEKPKITSWRNFNNVGAHSKKQGRRDGDFTSENIKNLIQASAQGPSLP